MCPLFEHRFEKQMASLAPLNWITILPPKQQKNRSLFPGEGKKENMGLWSWVNKVLLRAVVLVLRKGFKLNLTY